VCFIVANASSQFAVGQMLLMPPQEQAHGRLVKVYDTAWDDSKPKAKQRLKRNRRRRGHRRHKNQ
jgi:hypothetical protein